MLAYFEGKTDDAFKLALSDSQWHGMAGWKQAMKKAKHRDMVRYDNMLINR